MAKIETICVLPGGFLGLNASGEPAEVYQTPAQVAVALGGTNAPRPVIRPENYCSAVSRVLRSVEEGRKIDAIKDLRSMSYNGTIGLLEAKELVELLYTVMGK